MDFLWFIQGLLLNISQFFWDLYLETRDWVVPFNFIAVIFVSISNAFLSMTQNWTSFIAWVEEVQQMVQELGIWGTIRELIREWLPGLEATIVFFENMAAEVRLFFDDPIGYLQNVWENNILPWAEENIPFFSTLYHWFLSFTAELELFFSDPIGYLRDKWTNSVLPWLFDNVPFFATLYHWFLDFTDELELFFSDPIKYLFEIKDVDGLIHSILMEWLPFYDTLVEIWQEILDFFADPLGWVYAKIDEFFDRFWEGD